MQVAAHRNALEVAEVSSRGDASGMKGFFQGGDAVCEYAHQATKPETWIKPLGYWHIKESVYADSVV